MLWDVGMVRVLKWAGRYLSSYCLLTLGIDAMLMRRLDLRVYGYGYDYEIGKKTELDENMDMNMNMNMNTTSNTNILS